MNAIGCPLGGFPCPSFPCPGAIDPGVCRHLATLVAWSLVGVEAQVAEVADHAAKPRRPRAALDFLDRVRIDAEFCPFGSGPCGCGTVPRDCARPDRPDRVFRTECLDCRSQELWEAEIA